MKKIYCKPQTEAIALRGLEIMQVGSVHGSVESSSMQFEEEDDL